MGRCWREFLTRPPPSTEFDECKYQYLLQGAGKLSINYFFTFLVVFLTLPKHYYMLNKDLSTFLTTPNFIHIHIPRIIFLKIMIHFNRFLISFLIFQKIPRFLISSRLLAILIIPILLENLRYPY